MFKKTKSQDLTESDMEKRVMRGRSLPRTMTIDNFNKTFFADEKLSKLQCPINSQNDCVYEHSKEEVDEGRLHVKQTASPKSVMIPARVSKLGKTSIVYEEQRVKINFKQYRNHVLGRNT